MKTNYGENNVKGCTVPTRYIISAMVLFVAILYPYFIAINSVIFDFFSNNSYLVNVIRFLINILTATCAVRKNWFDSGILAVLISVFILWTLIVTYRLYTYPEAALSPLRFPVTILAYILVSLFVAQRSAFAILLSRVIIAQALIHSLIGLIHFTFFRSLMPGVDAGMPGKLYVYSDAIPAFYRETGWLGNASVYANFINIGMINLWASVIRKGKCQVVDVLFGIVMLLGVMISGSRFPFVFATMFFVLMLSSRLKKSTLIWAACTSFIVLLMVLSHENFKNILSIYVDRFQHEGNSVRNEKNTVLLGILSSIPNILIGASPFEVMNTTSPTGLTFSDNSFGEFILCFGVPYLFMWVGVVYVIMNSIVLRNRFWPIWCYVVGCLWFTNGILWDIWMWYLLITIGIVHRIDPHKVRRVRL